MRTKVLIAALLAIAAHAQDERPSPEFRRRAIQWLESTEAGRRQAARRSFLQLGPEAMPDYRKALEQAARTHNERLGRIAADTSNNPYAAHHELARQLDQERERVVPLIRTDWHKDNGKIRMLRDEVDGLARIWERTMRLAKADTTRFDAGLDGTVAALSEVNRELERFEPERKSASLTAEELSRFVIEDNIEGQFLIEQRDRYQASRAEAAALAAAERDNATAGDWASPSMRDFATLLNRERAIVGLPPVRLEEKLGAAARGHSQDMASMGFFSHTSPVTGKESPGDRAKLAGFTGGWSGENIFMGSPSHAAAYDGWFGSDGHRFIMFSTGPNVIGVGISGSHWTLMTGNVR